MAIIVDSSNNRNIAIASQDTEEEEDWFNSRKMILNMERRGIKRTLLDTPALGISMKRKEDTQN